MKDIITIDKDGEKIFIGLINEEKLIGTRPVPIVDGKKKYDLKLLAHKQHTYRSIFSSVGSIIVVAVTGLICWKIWKCNSNKKTSDIIPTHLAPDRITEAPKRNERDSNITTKQITYQ